MANQIVLVDDDPFSQKIAEDILESNGFEVTVLSSGSQLLDYRKKSSPDLILLDIRMPEMDGFETLKKVRELEEELDLEDIPVVFLTSETSSETETRAFELGISDFIRKPFEPVVLIRRITNVLSRHSVLYNIDEETTRDNLTGLLNKTAVSSKLEMLCRRKPGYLMRIQLDTFKMVDDFYGHAASDKLLVSFAILVRGFLGPEDVAGRFGWNEFVAFSSFLKSEEDLKIFSENLNTTLLADAKKILGEDITLPIGASIGIAVLRGKGEEYDDALRKAARAQHQVKYSGMHGYCIYEEEESTEDSTSAIKEALSILPSEALPAGLAPYGNSFENSLSEGSNRPEPLWVTVVDDDEMNLRLAERILTKNDVKVTKLSSGEALMDFLDESRPDLILLDIIMPGMDGFETLERLHTGKPKTADIPVIFLTAENDTATEKKALKLGAKDFIRKPFIPEILTMRVKQIAELLRLQKNLSEEVERKTKENELLFLHVVSSLAGAIDAKDTYTNGHSSRVAEYSKEIAKRFGYSQKGQNDIYILGLLHDVGKIGVPDSVINKPGRLTDEEFELIKRHPAIGSQILKNIREMPKLSIGARWHHERYDGTGYPDGLTGEEIPEEARIVAVADAYDAMSSKRSYRNIMPQEKIRSEIERGMGTQFDPQFARIMIQMIDEDTDFTMREGGRD